MVNYKLLVDTTGWRMMLPPSLQIYGRPRVTLIFEGFDLRTPKVDCFVDHLCHFTSKSVHSFSTYRVYKFCNRQTNGQIENIMPPWLRLADAQNWLTTIRYSHTAPGVEILIENATKSLLRLKLPNTH